MTEVLEAGLVLSDSNFRARPNFRTYLSSDASLGGNAVRQIEEKRRARQMKFPSLRGKRDYDSFQESTKENGAFKKWNDDGDFRAPAPYRSCDNILDPVSGFVSVGGDVDRNTGHTQIRSLVQLNDTPNSGTPKGKNSDRVSDPAAPPELRRSHTYAPGAPTPWNSRKISDAWIRAQLGGWTSDYDPRKTPPEELRSKSMFVAKPPSELSKGGRDHLALRYMYGSSTQRGYEELPWDSMLAPKMWQPVSTMEHKPDMISQRWSLKKYDPAAQEWQATGRGWDMFQTRKGYYKEEPYVFCSANPRADQIPSYGGCVGAKNLEEIDNAREPFQPFTVKRVTIPRPVETGHRPNIPGYTGCTLYQGTYSPAHSRQVASALPTTTDIHKSKPVSPNKSEFKRNSHMSKMVTTVPPCNPFNSVEKEMVTVS
ncbi:protein SPMIP7-like [Haliotis asinina]|uniref:protein SPMIP7-like n=1 Tax=Haliotis asinina TaxID=109174 RepID=UPI0035320078